MAQTMQLIGIGHVPAVPLSEVKPGDRLMWNYGSTYEVVSVTPVTRTLVELTERNERDGKTYTRRKRATRLVCRVPARNS